MEADYVREKFARLWLMQHAPAAARGQNGITG